MNHRDVGGRVWVGKPSISSVCILEGQRKVLNWIANLLGIDPHGDEGTLTNCEIWSPLQSGRCLDVTKGNTADGTRLQLWACKHGRYSMLNVSVAKSVVALVASSRELGGLVRGIAIRPAGSITA